MKFDNEVVIITGAGSGIGQATAWEFGKEGAKVVVSDINEDNGARVVAELQAAGITAYFQKADVSQDAEVCALIETTIAQFGRLDHMINNAGIGRSFEYFDEISDENYHDVIAVNQTGVFYCMRAALKIMKAQNSGTILNTSSLAGIGSAPRMGAYAASKHAVIGMTRTAAVEYGKYGIRINAICPTVINTPMGDDYLSDSQAVADMVKRSIPMRRFGEAIEVAKTIAWLCSRDASFINGQAIPIDGGMRA